MQKDPSLSKPAEVAVAEQSLCMRTIFYCRIFFTIQTIGLKYPFHTLQSHSYMLLMQARRQHVLLHHRSCIARYHCVCQSLFEKEDKWRTIRRVNRQANSF